jgi:phosphoglycerate kinase
VGGKIANEAIDGGMQFDSKVILPIDFAGEGRLDIGEKTIEKFCEIISHTETIVWNGPMGLFEKKPYDNGTRKILEAISKSGAFSVVGGGESVQAINESGLEKEISFVSTGGGAMLEFLSGEPMPGLEVLIQE